MIHPLRHLVLRVPALSAAQLRDEIAALEKQPKGAAQRVTDSAAFSKRRASESRRV